MVPSRDLVDLALKGKECQSSVAPDIFFCEVDSSPLLREECLYIPRVLDHFSVAQDLPAPYYRFTVWMPKAPFILTAWCRVWLRGC